MYKPTLNNTPQIIWLFSSNEEITLYPKQTSTIFQNFYLYIGSLQNNLHSSEWRHKFLLFIVKMLHQSSYVYCVDRTFFFWATKLQAENYCLMLSPLFPSIFSTFLSDEWWGQKIKLQPRTTLFTTSELAKGRKYLKSQTTV